MDDRVLPISLTDLCRQAHVGGQRLDFAREGSSVVYFCSAEEVSEGFAIALRAMGFDEILLSDLVARSHASSNPEES